MHPSPAFQIWKGSQRKLWLAIDLELLLQLISQGEVVGRVERFALSKQAFFGESATTRETKSLQLSFSAQPCRGSREFSWETLRGEPQRVTLCDLLFPRF
jgi:hypothetical protein